MGLAVFVVGSAGCALAPDVGTLIAARAVQGAGAALVMPLGLALVSTAFAPERRGKALGIYFGVTGLAVASGPVVGGAITEGLAWQWIFWINVPLGIAIIPFVERRIRESFGPHTAIDLVGLALVTCAAFGVVWGLVRGNPAGWGSTEVAGALVAGVLLAAAFVAWELRTRDPMLPMRFFRSRAFSAGNVSVFFSVAALFGAVFFLSQLQTGLGYGPLDAGLRLLPWTLTLFFVAPVAGALVDRFGERPFMVVGLWRRSADDASDPPPRANRWSAARARAPGSRETQHISRRIPHVRAGRARRCAQHRWHARGPARCRRAARAPARD